MIKAVIFDMDGVIVDTEPVHSKALEILIKQYGKTPLFKETGLVHTAGGEEMDQKVMEAHKINDSTKNFTFRRREIFVKLLEEKLTPMPGFLPLIKTLKKEKIKIGLASNRILKNISIIIKNLDIEAYFEVITGWSEAIHHKPAPDIYLEAVKSLGIDPKFCLAIEDSENGVESAKSAGMKVIAVPNRFTKSQSFDRADLSVSSLERITLKNIQNL